MWLSTEQERQLIQPLDEEVLRNRSKNKLRVLNILPMRLVPTQAYIPLLLLPSDTHSVMLQFILNNNNAFESE